MITRQGERISVEGPVTIANVRNVLGLGLAEIANGANEVDLAKVSAVDSSAISMMLEWMRAANRRISFFNMNQDLLSLTRLYGLIGVIPQGDAASPQ